ncbi:MAG: TetR/AcrR family transcriptional regulator [Bacteroidales bacterium]|nr:TetR/AcrR family transcriptional regulator [Bacteroidales bacterium]
MELKLENILDKVFEMYNRYGIKSVTMDDVASMLGMSKKTLYQYVKDKTELVEKVVERLIQNKECLQNEVYNKNFNALEEIFALAQIMNDHIKHYNPAMEYDLKKYYPAVYLKISETRRNKMYEAVAKNLRKGIANGLYREELDVDIITKIFVSRIELSLDNPVFERDEITSFKVFIEMMIYHLHGICNSKGLEIIQERLKDAPFSENLNQKAANA